MSCIHTSYSYKIGVFLVILNGAFQLAVSCFRSQNCAYTHLISVGKSSAVNIEKLMECGECLTTSDRNNFGYIQKADRHSHFPVTNQNVKKIYWIGKNIQTTEAAFENCRSSCPKLSLAETTFKKMFKELAPIYNMAVEFPKAEIVKPARFFSCF